MFVDFPDSKVIKYDHQYHVQRRGVAAHGHPYQNSPRFSEKVPREIGQF